MKKRLLSALLALMLLCAALPAGALAKSSPSIRFDPQVRLVYSDGSVKLRPLLHGIRRSNVKYMSSRPKVASVNTSGRVQAAKQGLTVITAYCGSTVGKCGIISLPRKVTLKIGQKKQLPYAGVETFTVADNTVARLTKKGALTGRKAGTTTVTVKYRHQKLKIQVTVKPERIVESRAAKLKVSKGKDVKQIVLVEYKGGSDATLSVHEKRGGYWKELYSCDAYVGKNGIDKVKEGDKRTPTGTYNLTTPFGIKADPGANMPYTWLTKYHYWCGSSSSKYYNQMVDSRVTGRKCTSSDENLTHYGAVYNYCMFIDYNVAGVAGKGSCIFLHCKGKHAYTGGCVAVDEADMVKILRWAKPGVKIVIGNPI